MSDELRSPHHGVVRRRSEVWHSDRDCTTGSALEELTTEEAREEEYTACLECCPEGWPDE